jgi:HlyD family secretion protein
MGKPLKLSIAGAVLVGVAAVAVMGARRNDKKAVEVKIEQVGRRDLVSSVTASGQVIPHTKVDVAADISGRIVRLAVKEGDIVTQGQFLLQIEPEQYAAAVQRQEAALAAAQAQAAQAQANLIQAERAYERMAKIKAQNANLVSESELDQLKTASDVNKALSDASKHQVEQAAAGLRDARQALAKTTINAPMSGRVTRLNVEQGETAVPGTFNKDAATLLTISDMGVLETKVKVDETDVAHINLGDSAVVQIDAFPDTTFLGKVTKISNSSVKSATGQQAADQAIDFEVTIQLVNPPQETRPDFSATAKIITDARKSVVSIPIIALTVRENEALANKDTSPTMGGRQPQKEVGKKDVEGVFIVGKDNKVTFRPVKVGIAGDRYFEVLGGLKEGETIVAGTYQAIRDLKDGQLVRQAVDKNAKDAKAKTAAAGAKS